MTGNEVPPSACDRCLALSELLPVLAQVPRLRPLPEPVLPASESGTEPVVITPPLVATAEGLAPTPGELIRAVDGVGPARARKVAVHLKDWSADAVRDAAITGGLTAICMCSAWYPAALRRLSDPPPVLYVRGSLAVIGEGEENAIAMVGTRRPTMVGRDAAKRIAAGITRSGGTVISGMAFGIDAAAHQGALSVGGSTVAVLAGGANFATPPSHQRLYDEILERGTVVSEMPPGRHPERWSFPARNRIIAALSRATVVVEAPLKSGALITVEQATDLGKDVYAVPGSLASDVSEGTNRMLCDGAGAVVDGAVLAAQLGMTRVAGLAGPSDGPLADVHAALSRGAMSIAELGVRTGGLLEAGEIELALLDLELAGWVSRRPDGRYRVVDRWAA